MALALDESKRDLTNERGGELGANHLPMALAAIGGVIALVVIADFIGVLFVMLGVVLGGLIGMGFVEAKRSWGHARHA